MADIIRLYRELVPLRHIRRFQQHSCISPISVMEHSYGVAILAGAMAAQLTDEGVPVDRAKVMEAALWHDVGEVVLGDIPHPAKRISAGVEAALDSLEFQVIRHISVDAGCPGWPEFPILDEESIEWAIVRVCDWVELVMYVSEEQAAGNRTLDPPQMKILELLCGPKCTALFNRHGEVAGQWYRNFLHTWDMKDDRSRRAVFSFKGTAQ